MLRLKRSLIDAKRGDNDERQTKDEREMINSNIFPISYDSITSLLAISVYDAYIFGQTFDVPSMNLLPMVLDYKWIGKECLGLILRLVGNAQRFAHVDKGLFLLIFLAKHVDITIDVQTLTESQLPGPLVGHQNFDLIQGLQVMSSVAAMCPNADLRYAAYQLISCFINMCANDAQLFVFMELFDSCPLETMRAAAVGLLKNQICEQNLFNSNVIADKLFPRLFKKPNTSTLWDRYGFEMQVLNLYLYLLIRDKPPSRVRKKE
ncbi:hypothetical protein BDB00DRAFT_762493 [Zychaea mexicana]|uniref:uncharacterized protein n=1 Tax=Zychaea mexicana TaxID=64656 RepID=UPI0022FDE6B5|nr:uncharacterized protein BDB00DRAFT_762493 [Zychaea mexicana]KAI9494183.1 hypothetical protein BDB00DRAFT_762493 [Zychaea mexicana]